MLPLVVSVPVQSLVSVSFPACGAIVAAAASVSKARCELDAEAATAAAMQVASVSEEDQSRPFRAVGELVRLTVRPVVDLIRRRFRRLRWRLLSPPERLAGARDELIFWFQRCDRHLTAAHSTNALHPVDQMKCPRIHAPRMHYVNMRRYDADSDGLISEDEMRRVLSAICESEASARRVLASFADVRLTLQADGVGGVPYTLVRKLMESEWKEYGPPLRMGRGKLRVLPQTATM